MVGMGNAEQWTIRGICYVLISVSLITVFATWESLKEVKQEDRNQWGQILDPDNMCYTIEQWLKKCVD